MTTVDNVAWPPEYTVKKHPRAKSVKLRTSRKKGLEITIPPRFRIKDIPQLLEEHKTWIIKKLSAIQTQAETALPSKIELHSSNEVVQVFYLKVDMKLKMITRPHNEIVFVGKMEDGLRCKRFLNTYIRKRATTFLLKALESISQEVGLGYQEARVKNQATLWGSCTVEKVINLNYKLIFLPAALVRHVLIHELCHTVHHNHSSAFWQMVARFDPECEANKQALREGNKWIPGWVD